MELDYVVEHWKRISLRDYDLETLEKWLDELRFRTNLRPEKREEYLVIISELKQWIAEMKGKTSLENRYGTLDDEEEFDHDWGSESDWDDWDYDDDWDECEVE